MFQPGLISIGELVSVMEGLKAGEPQQAVEEQERYCNRSITHLAVP